MVGEARRITPSSALIRYRLKARRNCSQALLGSDSSLAPLKQLLIARTEGNPFFFEESVRTLVETKFLVGERGSYRLEKTLESTQVPATVQAVLGGSD